MFRFFKCSKMRFVGKVTRCWLRIWPPGFRITSHVSYQVILMLLVPDDIIIDLVRERLDRPDCRTNGWILEGCPMNIY